MNKHLQRAGLALVAVGGFCAPAFAAMDAATTVATENLAAVSGTIATMAGSYVSAGETLLTVAAAILAWKVGAKLIHKTT